MESDSQLSKISINSQETKRNEDEVLHRDQEDKINTPSSDNFSSKSFSPPVIEKKINNIQDLSSYKDYYSKYCSSLDSRHYPVILNYDVKKQTNHASKSTSQNSRWGWIIIGASFFVNLISDGVAFSFGIIYTEFLDYFQLDHGTTAWIGGIFVAIPMLSGPVASHLTEKFGCRKMTILGAILASTGFIISSLTDSFTVLCLTFGILAGSGLSLCYVSSVVIVANYFEKRRSFAIGLALSGSGIGTFLFAPLIEALIEAYGWRGTTLILGGIFLNLLVCGALMREPRRKKNVTRQKIALSLQQNDEQAYNELSRIYCFNRGLPNETISQDNLHLKEIESISQTKNEKNENTSYPVRKVKESNSNSFVIFPKQTVFEIEKRSHSCPALHRIIESVPLDEHEEKLSYREKVTKFMREGFNFKHLLDIRFFIYALSNFLLYTWYDVPYVYLKDYALQKNLSSFKSSTLISLIGICNMIGEICLGWIGDYPSVDNTIVYAFCMIVTGTLACLVPITDDYIGLCFISGGFGLFLAANYALTCVILVDIITIEHFPRAYGLIYMVQGVGNLIGPPIGGWLYDLTKTYDWCFYFTGIFIALSGIILLILPVTNYYKKLKSIRVVSQCR